MANKITWADKVALQEKPDVVAENKVTAADMNQIKTAVNETIDTMPSNLVNGQAEGSIRSISARDETGSLLGKYAQAFGYLTTASGEKSHAEGEKTTALAWASHTEGKGTIAKDEAQHVQGKYNIESSSLAHILGNGTRGGSPDYTISRSNAHTIDWSGNAWFAGDVYVKSTSGTNKDSGSKKLATEEYVTNLVGDVETILTTLTTGSGV